MSAPASSSRWMDCSCGGVSRANFGGTPLNLAPDDQDAGELEHPSRRVPWTGVLLCLLAALRAVVGVHLAWSGPRNLVANGPFATSSDGWRPWQGRDQTTGTWRCERRSCPGRLDGKAERIRCVRPVHRPRPVVNLDRGMTFTADASVRTAEPGRLVCLVVREWDMSRQLAVGQKCVTGKGFRPFRIRRAGAEGVRTHGYTACPASRGDWFAVDDVTLALRG